MTDAAWPCRSAPMRVLALALALNVGGAARAQDALAEVLDAQKAAEAPAVATAPQAAAPPPSTPASPPQAAGSVAMPAQPSIDEADAPPPDGPPNETAAAYEARLRASVAAAQALQGPLDGRWTLYGDDGKALYIFMFTDPPNGRGPLEAAWRDPNRIRGMDDLGIVDVVGRDGVALTLTFATHAGQPMTRVELQAGSTGGFDGKLSQAGAVRTVSLRR